MSNESESTQKQYWQVRSNNELYYGSSTGQQLSTKVNKSGKEQADRNQEQARSKPGKWEQKWDAGTQRLNSLFDGLAEDKKNDYLVLDIVTLLIS